MTGRCLLVLAALACPAGAAVPERDRFAEVPRLEAASIPATGTADPRLSGLDEALRGFMAEHGIPALSFALGKDGRLLHERAFGWADAAMSTPLRPAVRLRLASLTKPVVAATTLALIREGKFGEDTRVFDYLGLGRFAEAGDCDPRWKEVTVRQLLDHRGGWDKAASGDFTSEPRSTAELFGIETRDVTPTHLVRQGLARPLDFDPGDRASYCNFGYILLARMIEKAGGRSFEEQVLESVGRPAGADSFLLSSSRSPGRDPEEGWYCYHPEVSDPGDPGFIHTAPRDGAGGLACTAADYCRFLGAFWISGKPREAGPRFNYRFHGSYPGVTSVAGQRADGLNYAAIANRRPTSDTRLNGALEELIDSVLDGFAEEP